jgi:hypothetical protein
MSLDRTVRLVTESLARTVSRRKFLWQLGGSAFAGVAALMVGDAPNGRAFAGEGPMPVVPECAPPGPFCNLDGNGNDPNGCHGASCFQHRHKGQVLQCRVYYEYWKTGCWTNPVTGGYWTCCDCECGTPTVATCGCAQFSSQPYPRPDNPLAGAAT